MFEKIKNKIKENDALIIAVVIILVGVSILFYTSGVPSVPLEGRSGSDSILSTTTMTLDFIGNRDSVIMIQGPAVLHSMSVGPDGGEIALFNSLTTADTTSIIFSVTGSIAQVWDLSSLGIDAGLLLNTTGQNSIMFNYTDK